MPVEDDGEDRAAHFGSHIAQPSCQPAWRQTGKLRWPKTPSEHVGGERISRSVTGGSQLDYDWGIDDLRTRTQDQQVISPNEKNRGSEGLCSSFGWGEGSLE